LNVTVKRGSAGNGPRRHPPAVPRFAGAAG
jgi:hypothetical protein